MPLETAVSAEEALHSVEAISLTLPAVLRLCCFWPSKHLSMFEHLTVQDCCHAPDIRETPVDTYVQACRWRTAWLLVASNHLCTLCCVQARHAVGHLHAGPGGTAHQRGAARRLCVVLQVASRACWPGRGSCGPGGSCRPPG